MINIISMVKCWIVDFEFTFQEVRNDTVII